MRSSSFPILVSLSAIVAAGALLLASGVSAFPSLKRDVHAVDAGSNLAKNGRFDPWPGSVDFYNPRDKGGQMLTVSYISQVRKSLD